MTQLYVVIFCAVLTVGLFGARLSQLERRINKLSSLDAKLDLLLKYSGLEYDPYKNLPPKVVEAVEGGRKIEAIKSYREVTGVDLKEAKEFIEEVQRRGSPSLKPAQIASPAVGRLRFATGLGTNSSMMPAKARPNRAQEALPKSGQFSSWR